MLITRESSCKKGNKTNRLEMLLSYSGFPMLILPRGMRNCIDDDFILNHSENDAVGKWARADLPALLANSVEERIAW